QLKATHFRNFLNTHNEYFNHFCSVEENYRQLIGSIGIETDVKHGFPGMAKEDRGKEVDKPYIAINNTCSELAYVRKFPDQKLKEISNWLLVNTSYKLAFCGAPGDYHENQDFIEKYFSDHLTNGRLKNLAGQFAIADFYHFLHRECAFMISVDSAPLHIARKLGLPTISAWGPTNPLNYLEIPEEEKHRHLYHYLGVHCSPCIHHTLVLPCGGDNFCMKNMETAKITFLIEKIMVQIQNSEHANA
ncbi:MAG: hypothetical protein BRD49_01035, partial [Bacteroidetes bacterium SW_10_40_5]